MIHLVGLLQDLFQQIDVYATGTVTYKDFTSYCVEAARQKTSGKQISDKGFEAAYTVEPNPREPTAGEPTACGCSHPQLPHHSLVSSPGNRSCAPDYQFAYKKTKSKRLFNQHRQKRIKYVSAISRLMSVPEHASTVTLVSYVCC